MEATMRGRAARRAEFEGEVAILRGDRELQARARDISSKGMLIICTEGLLWDGGQVTVLFHLPGDVGPMALKGTVVQHGSPAHCAWGVKFHEVPDEFRALVEAYVAARTQGPPPIPQRSSESLDATAVTIFDESQCPTEDIPPGTLEELRAQVDPPAPEAVRPATEAGEPETVEPGSSELAA
jgi:hypothetical protein